jgi:hypothetical protein
MLKGYKKCIKILIGKHHEKAHSEDKNKVRNNIKIKHGDTGCAGELTVGVGYTCKLQKLIKF